MYQDCCKKIYHQTSAQSLLLLRFSNTGLSSFNGNKDYVHFKTILVIESFHALSNTGCDILLLKVNVLDKYIFANIVR